MREELKGLKIGVFDWEANGFLETVDRTYCMSLVDVATKKLTRFISGHSGEIQAALNELDTFDILAGHNLIGYDLCMLKKLYGWVPGDHVIILDTLWMSRMYSPDLDGGHSLGAWGERLGNSKIEYYPIHDPQQSMYNPDADISGKNDKGWDTAEYTDNMGVYCDKDVMVNLDLFNKLLTLLANFSWRSIICEMETAVIIQRQMQVGFAFKYKEAELFHAELMDRQGELEDEVRETFYPIPKAVRVVQPKVKADGSISSVGLKKLDGWETSISTPEYIETEDTSRAFSVVLPDGSEEVRGIRKAKEYTSGSFTLIEYPEFSLGSRQQIAERLVRAGFTLTRFTEKGNAIIDETTLADAVKAGIKEAVPLDEYFMVSKRESMVKSWIEKAVWHEDQGVYRLHGFVNSIGACTNRMTHNTPNMAQVPASHSPYGKTCRGLFTVKPGYRLVGCDADGLELRCLAEYMNDLEYIAAVVGGDVHWVNTLALGLIASGTIRQHDNETHDEVRSRAKTWIYAFLYGAGVARLAWILGVTNKVAKQKMEQFLDATPALKKLRAKIKAICENRKWLKGRDGRIIRVRSAHSALNTLLQGMGAIVMKYWLIEVAKNADAEGLDWNPVANVHDEGQFEVVLADVDRFKEICEQAFLTISEDLELKCVCTGSAMDGESWVDTH